MITNDGDHCQEIELEDHFENIKANCTEVASKTMISQVTGTTNTATTGPAIVREGIKRHCRCQPNRHSSWIEAAVAAAEALKTTPFQLEAIAQVAAASSRLEKAMNISEAMESWQRWCHLLRITGNRA